MEVKMIVRIILVVILLISALILWSQLGAESSSILDKILGLF